MNLLAFWRLRGGGGGGGGMCEGDDEYHCWGGLSVWSATSPRPRPGAAGCLVQILSCVGACSALGVVTNPKFCILDGE